jgi:hypothetical protein
LWSIFFCIIVLNICQVSSKIIGITSHGEGSRFTGNCDGINNTQSLTIKFYNDGKLDMVFDFISDTELYFYLSRIELTANLRTYMFPDILEPSWYYISILFFLKRTQCSNILRELGGKVMIRIQKAQWNQHKRNSNQAKNKTPRARPDAPESGNQDIILYWYYSVLTCTYILWVPLCTLYCITWFISLYWNIMIFAMKIKLL